MLTWFFNPWMLFGGLAIGIPILIHLLNKRRFKIVDWAAMDFLFEADKKNRRRVQVENLILLLLRCLAMLLGALMLARPFLPSSVANVMQQTQQIERVLLIDDSLSQRVLVDSVPALQKTQENVKEMLSKFANDPETEDWLTVYLTSNPTQPLLDNKPLTENVLAELSQTIDQIECSDQVADYSVSLSELSRYLQGKRENVGRAAYIYTDMRTRDWMPLADLQAESAPNQLIQKIADSAINTFVIDTGSDNSQNVAVTSVRPYELLVADKTISFLVSVSNYGTQTVSDLKILFQINEDQPQYETIGSIAPGQTETLEFNCVFSGRDLSMLEFESESIAPFENFRIRAEIDRQSLGDTDLALDQLLEDSSRLYAARVMDGIPVLLVDGDPSSVAERSETHYLRSLAVLGTGLKMDVATVSELETVSLSDYSAIYLCNVDEASPDRLKSIMQWVEDGGALVLMPGNRVRAGTFNDSFYQDGNGLSPLKLNAMMGDPTMSKWVNFEIDPQIHPALKVIVDSDASSLSKVDIFSWWTSEIAEEQIGKTVQVPMRLSDRDNSPAMVEKSLGDGRVVIFTLPGDGDWTMWPSSPTFVPVMIDLIDYLVGNTASATGITLGESISYPIDLSAYQNRVALRDPKNEKTETVAKPIDPTAEQSLLYRAEFADLNRAGFYELQLTNHTGEVEPVVFASNYDVNESQLKRLSESERSEEFFGNKVSLVSMSEIGEQTVSGGNTEIWIWILVVLFGILVTEQFLGWWWGKKR
jgi:uncharacterized membrane protein